MKKKLTILIVAILILGSASIIKSIESDRKSNEKIVKVDEDGAEKTDIDSKSQLESKWEMSPKDDVDKNQVNRDKNPRVLEGRYIGEALDRVNDKGEINIYSEKDNNSQVIHILKDYDKVVLLETLPYGWFKVKLENGRVGYVDARYIRAKEIPPHDYDKDSEEWVIVFSDENQSVDIYKKGELVEKSLASGGTWDSFTPKGVFEIESGRRGEWFFAERFMQGGKYWVGFRDSYLFHSLPCNEDQIIIKEEANKLGQPASHGCIRLPEKIAKYIYDNVPDGSLVIIE
ncbi:MAG TPA: L,D-transpeptidase family protein [Tissierellales bacterium]|nr:L,D-transpeptidase family protein [Tissierellales bacterium]